MNLGWTEILLILFVVLVIFLIPMIFFLIAQQNTLRAVSPQNRKMQPGEVWLQLIPLFGLVWKFIVVSRIAQSIRAEINERNTNSFLGDANPVFANDYTPLPTYNIGLAYCILGLCGFIPILGWLATIGWLVCWIIYWTQIVAYKNKLTNNIM
jgi:hypothetical protein